MQGKSAGATYRVHTPLVALKYVSDSGSQFVTIPRGATIRVTGERKELGLVEIQYEGEAVATLKNMRSKCEAAGKLSPSCATQACWLAPG
jgi:hypothetical protein